MPTPPPSLRATRQITWTQPPSRQEAAAIAEIELIEEMTERTPEQEERRRQLIRQLPPAPSWRFTLATMSVSQAGRYDANRRAVKEWIQQATGQPIQDALKSRPGLAMFDAGIKWAQALAALTRIEYRPERRINRPADEVDENAEAPSEWAQLDLPPAWSSPETAVEEIPADLLEFLADAADELNPILTGPDMSQEAKKNGGASAA